jgi:hypothetical protein
VLEELDEKLYRGEGLRVGVETVGVGSAIDHGIRAPLVEEQMLEGDRWANDVLCEGFASLRAAGREVDRCVDAESAVGPLEHASAQPLVQELALQEERDDPLAEAGAHSLQIDLRDVDEPALVVKASLQEQAMPVGMEPAKRSRAQEDHDCGYTGRLAGGLCCEVAHQLVDEAADLAVESLVVSEEDAQDLGQREHELPVRQPKQELLVHVLA